MNLVELESISEKNKMISMLDSVYDSLKEVGAFVAGGSIASLFTHKDINDLDVYFPSQDALATVIADIFCEDTVMSGDIGSFEMIYNGHSKKTLMFKTKADNQEVQFITMRYFSSAEEIFESFDFTVCMGAFCCETGKFILHEDFMKHNAQRYLKFNYNTLFPIVSALRVDKYRNKGYKISKSEYLRVIFACMALNDVMIDWDDAIEHIGGLYGYDVSEFFDRSKEFSMVELMDQLEHVTDEKAKVAFFLKNDGASFKKVCEVFYKVDQRELESLRDWYKNQKDDHPFRDGFLYKCVNSEYKSSISTKKIHYKEGDILDTDDHGAIYFHYDPLRPYTNTKFWIEAELLGNSSSESSSMREKKVLSGKVKITRAFEHELVDPDLYPDNEIAEVIFLKRLKKEKENKVENKKVVYAHPGDRNDL